MRFHVLSVVGLAVLSFGCSGGQTGDLSGNRDDGGETAGNGCIERREELAGFDVMTDYGSAEQMLAFAEGSFEAPLSWKEPAARASWTAGPETGASGIRIEVTRGESAYLLTYEQESDSGGREGLAIGRVCPEPQLGVEAQVTVTTDGGALAESFDTLLRGTGAGMASFNVPLDLSTLDGSLEVAYAQPKAKLVQLSVNATLMPEGSTGSISGIEEVNHGEAVSAGQAVLAVWPDAPACAGDPVYGGAGLSVAPGESALGITGHAAGELLSGMTPVDVTWIDGQTTELTLTTTLLGDGCLRATQSPVPDDPRGIVTYPARFELHSADGRLQGEYTGKLTTYPEEGETGVSAEAVEELTLAQVSESGFANASVPSSADRLTVWFEARRAGVIESGAVRLSAITDPECDTQPSEPALPGMGASSPGCPGSAITPIEAATWGQP